jgi:hypothetical protein
MVGQGMEHRCGPDHRMAGEPELTRQVEHPGGPAARPLGRAQEDRLEVAELPGDRAHLVAVQARGLREDRQAVARVGL